MPFKRKTLSAHLINVESSQVAAEHDRVRQLREKVESQEMKLKKLRALRGQVNDYKGSNNNLSKDSRLLPIIIILLLTNTERT